MFGHEEACSREFWPEPEPAALLTDADRRGLTALFWLYIRPYSEVHLDIGQLLAIGS